MSTAYVLINCDLGSEEFVISELKSIEGVTEVHGTFGAYDILAKVQADLVEKLRETITWKIRKIVKIRSTLTLMGIEGQGWLNNRKISFNNNLDKEFIKNLSTKLYEWTDERWIISLSQKIGQPSQKEKTHISKNQSFEEAKKDEVYKKFLELFPDAELIDIKSKNEN